MTIVMNDACTINVSNPHLLLTVVIINVEHHLQLSIMLLVVSYAPNIFIIQASGSFITVELNINMVQAEENSYASSPAQKHRHLRKVY
jgi:hypothetical protein